MAGKDCNCGCPDCTGKSVFNAPRGAPGMTVAAETAGLTREQAKAHLMRQAEAMPQGFVRDLFVGQINLMK